MTNCVNSSFTEFCFSGNWDSVRSSVCSLLNTAGLLFKVCLDKASQAVEVVAFLQIFIF